MTDSNEHGDIAIEGMLRELGATGGAAPDMDYVERVMKAVHKDAKPVQTIERPRPSLVRQLQVVAALFVVGGIGVWFWMQPGPVGTVADDSLLVERNGKVRSFDYGDRLFAGDAVIPNKIATVNLSDGSVVTIDAQSRLLLATPEDDERIRLVLKKGRVFLRVSKGKGRFVVDAGAPVEVLGTTFGVIRTGNGARVAVYEGRVGVGQNEHRVEITRGEAATIDAGGYGSMAKLDVNNELAWARKDVAFNQQPLGELIDWIETNSAYRFTISDDLRKNVKVIAGVNSTTDIRKVLAYIVTTNQLKCQLNGNDVVMSR